MKIFNAFKLDRSISHLKNVSQVRCLHNFKAISYCKLLYGKVKY